MSKKSNSAQYDEDVEFLAAREVVQQYRGDKKCSDDRICYCCGGGFIGTPTWSAQMRVEGHIDEKIEWNTQQIIAADFIDKNTWPILNKDRLFIRISGEEMDMLISWEGT